MHSGSARAHVYKSIAVRKILHAPLDQTRRATEGKGSPEKRRVKSVRKSNGKKIEPRDEDRDRDHESKNDDRSEKWSLRRGRRTCLEKNRRCKFFLSAHLNTGNATAMVIRVATSQKENVEIEQTLPIATLLPPERKVKVHERAVLFTRLASISPNPSSFHFSFRLPKI